MQGLVGDLLGQHRIVDVEARQLLAWPYFLKQSGIGHQFLPLANGLLSSHNYSNSVTGFWLAVTALS